MYAVFDINKNFISYSDGKFGENFLFRDIPSEQSDLLSWRWEGDYDTGNMVAIEESPYPISDLKNIFEEKYPLSIFFTILLKQLFLTSTKNKSIDPLFGEMVKNYIIAYEDNDSYISLLREANKTKL
jgi:hypothetical protein